MTKEFLIAGFTGKLKVWFDSHGTRHVFKEAVPVIKDVGYVLIHDEITGQGKMIKVHPPAYVKGLGS